ncbi:Detected protein of unknown function [Hibiscus syriacus]|uniref:Uncharacterized protein n=1 Tax=Hibiscus syriacus TaxID=106335 RepID=A0A6A3CTW6_HIBSY|nr:uncharacterized protein LOC120144108 [Hibiscus syriacus]KAE8732007.1 Detected protein of unknown function [Hibiscus syriacus]
MEEKKENVNTALFTAGIAVLVVCLKRALLLFLVQQWRAWVFLVVNLVLLAIFFTSINPNSSQQEINRKDEESKKTSGGLNEVEACKEEDNDEVVNSKKRRKCEDVEEVVEKRLMVEEEEEEENIEALKLSKEELNERVEAFIAMFRQHLASDARKGRNQSDLKKKHTSLSADGVNSFVLKVR